LQSFTQKYSNANSYHDNFNKTLSSHLNQYSDMLKAMLNF
jgi:invasin D